MERMKRIKEKDWTRVLQERLQDARLPLEDGWAEVGPKPRGIPGHPSNFSGDGPNQAAFPGRWWPWALAGVAAAAVAAFLLLRPTVNPAQTPDRLAQQTQTPAARPSGSSLNQSGPQSSHSGLDPEPQEPADGVFQTGGPELFFGSRKTNSGSANPTAGVTEERQPSSSTRPTAPDGTGQRAQANAQPAHRLPQEDPSSPESAEPTSPSFAGLTGESPSTKTAQNEDGGAKNEGSSTKIAQNVDGIRIAEPGPTLAELALADLEEIPEEPERPRRRLAGRVSLRVQAATAGTSFSGGVTPATNPTQLTMGDGQWLSVDGGSNAVSYLSGNNDDGYLNSNIGNSQNGPNANDIEWLYVRRANEHEESVVSVPKAPALPVTFGVSLSLPLARNWVLSAGLDYMQRDGYRLYGDTPQSLTLHYLGIPVDLQYYFNPESRWRFYLGAGVHAAKCIAATGGQPLQDPVLFSGNLMAGTDIRIFPGVRFYLAPVLSAPFNRSAYVNSWDDKLQFQLRAGLSFDLK